MKILITQLGAALNIENAIALVAAEDGEIIATIPWDKKFAWNVGTCASEEEGKAVVQVIAKLFIHGDRVLVYFDEALKAVRERAENENNQPV